MMLLQPCSADEYPSSSAQVMAITSTGQIRSFHSVQFAVNVANPSWLPDAVASLLSAETLDQSLSHSG